MSTTLHIHADLILNHLEQAARLIDCLDLNDRTRPEIIWGSTYISAARNHLSLLINPPLQRGEKPLTPIS